MEKLSSIFLSPAISIELFLEFFLLIVLTYTLFQTVFILKNYQKETITDIEDFVEKKSYLVSILVSLALIIKIVLIAFFTYALDSLSSIVPGAMCMTGVLNTNEYGEVLIVLKLFVLLFSSLWLLLNKADLYSKEGAFFTKKMWFFIVLYIVIFAEFILSLLFLSSIDTQTPVLCCLAKNVVESRLPFGISISMLVSLFYTFYIVVMYSAYKQQKLLLFIATLIFVYLAYYANVYYFATFVYEAWAHNCPYCMLQAEYNFIGYFIYGSFFLFVFYTLGYLLFDFMKKTNIRLIVWLNIFVFVMSSSLFV